MQSLQTRWRSPTLFTTLLLRTLQLETPKPANSTSLVRSQYENLWRVRRTQPNLRSLVMKYHYFRQHGTLEHWPSYASTKLDLWRRTQLSSYHSAQNSHRPLEAIPTVRSPSTTRKLDFTICTELSQASRSTFYILVGLYIRPRTLTGLSKQSLISVCLVSQANWIVHSVRALTGLSNHV